MTKSTIAIIGTGNQGPALARQFARAGYPVILGSRDGEKGARIASELGHSITGGAIAEAVAAGDIIILAVPYTAAAETAAATGPMAGKVVIDTSNPFTSDLEGLMIGHTTSAGEELQKLLPEARVVKAFHLFFATWLNAGKYEGGPTYISLHAGDDEAAKQSVADLAAAIGFEPVDAGPLVRAHFLEPLAVLILKLGHEMLVRVS